MLRKFIFTPLLLLGLLAVLSWLTLARPFILFPGEKIEIARPNPAALEGYTQKISKDFFPRDWKHSENLDRLAEYISSEFQSTNTRVMFQPYTVEGVSYRNVISEYGPSDGEAIIIGAHYDACGEYPGADDNASGVAGLLELGRLLSESTLPLRTILVAFTLEEPPFFGTSNMGSAIHAASLVATGTKVKLMLSLEMIGYFSDAANSQNYPVPLLDWIYPSKGNFIALVGPLTMSPATLQIKEIFMRSMSIPVLSINAPASIPGIDFSDHRNYWKEGFDAVMVTDTAFLRNRAYHTEGDVAERLNYEKMAQVVAGVHAYALSIEAGT